MAGPPKIVSSIDYLGNPKEDGTPWRRAVSATGRKAYSKLKGKYPQLIKPLETHMTPDQFISLGIFYLSECHIGILNNTERNYLCIIVISCCLLFCTQY